MDTFTEPEYAIAISMWLLLWLLSSTGAPVMPWQPPADAMEEDPPLIVAQNVEGDIFDAKSLMRATLHQFRFCIAYNFLDEELGFWVKPRSTTWFSRFLLEQYDNGRWVQMFRMTKPAVLALAEVLRPVVQKENTKYRLAIPTLIRVACTLFKLAHGANLTVCSEMFAIGKSIVSMVLQEVVYAVNDTLRHKICWPTGERLRETEASFFQVCGLPGVVGAIDGTQVAISKPHFVPADYYYFKSGGYSLNCQTVVDSNRRFIDLYLGMPGSTNDSHMLRRSSLYHLAMHNNMMDPTQSICGFSPYLIGDLGYPLLPWLMVPHKNPTQLSVSERMFNTQLRRGRCVVENAFGILKQTFRELLFKSDFRITFLPDVILCCAILHNVLLGQSHEAVEELLEVLRREGLDGAATREDGDILERAEAMRDEIVGDIGSEKRKELGIFLIMQRRPQS